ncbi:Hypothetical protein P9211_08091 [Prochlorococcus marinus str. MIT 9211]|uniref:Abasic site processing protein n=2 Tax=Prochlorococcus marinus TaxID=1219 RepID=A9BA78_PROM4|nr:Hypothetical protein P9211_08091 [Prochlorococcus marinus str. MIT 9211]
MCGTYSLSVDLENLPRPIKNSLSSKHKKNYQPRELIRPSEPILSLKAEGEKTSASLMLWGLIPSWAKNLEKCPKPFNARAETILDKPTFRNAWRHHRCLIPASAFYEKSHLIKRKDSAVFWLAGLWNRWISADGSEIDTCSVITTQSNNLVKPIHSRMPLIISMGFENYWIKQKDALELRTLERILLDKWSPEGWIVKPMLSTKKSYQMSLF